MFSLLAILATFVLLGAAALWHVFLALRSPQGRRRGALGSRRDATVMSRSASSAEPR